MVRKPSLYRNLAAPIQYSLSKRAVFWVFGITTCTPRLSLPHNFQICFSVLKPYLAMAAVANKLRLFQNALSPLILTHPHYRLLSPCSPSISFASLYTVWHMEKTAISCRDSRPLTGHRWHLLPDQPLLPGKREAVFCFSCSNHSANPSHSWCLGFHGFEFIILYFPKLVGPWLLTLRWLTFGWN